METRLRWTLWGWRVDEKKAKGFWLLWSTVLCVGEAFLIPFPDSPPPPREMHTPYSAYTCIGEPVCPSVCLPSSACHCACLCLSVFHKFLLVRLFIYLFVCLTRNFPSLSLLYFIFLLPFFPFSLLFAFVFWLFPVSFISGLYSLISSYLFCNIVSCFLFLSSHSVIFPNFFFPSAFLSPEMV